MARKYLIWFLNRKKIVQIQVNSAEIIDACHFPIKTILINPALKVYLKSKKFCFYHLSNFIFPVHDVYFELVKASL